MKLTLTLALVVSSAAVACGGSAPANTPKTGAAVTPDAPGAAVPRPACIAIHDACERYENETAKGKECHDLGESPATTDTVCAQKQEECLAACPKK